MSSASSDSGPPSPRAPKPLQLGKIAVARGFITERQLGKALQLQRATAKGVRLGELLIRQGWVTAEQWKQVHAEHRQRLREPAEHTQKPHQDSLLGKQAVALGLITEEELHECLRLQGLMERKGKLLRLGQILVDKRLLTVQQARELLESQKKNLMKCGSCGRQYNVVRPQPGQVYRCPKCKMPLFSPETLKGVQAEGSWLTEDETEPPPGEAVPPPVPPQAPHREPVSAPPAPSPPWPVGREPVSAPPAPPAPRPVPPARRPVQRDRRAPGSRYRAYAERRRQKRKQKAPAVVVAVLALVVCLGVVLFFALRSSAPTPETQKRGAEPGVEPGPETPTTNGKSQYSSIEEEWQALRNYSPSGWEEIVDHLLALRECLKKAKGMELEEEIYRRLLRYEEKVALLEPEEATSEGDVLSAIEDLARQGMVRLAIRRLEHLSGIAADDGPTPEEFEQTRANIMKLARQQMDEALRLAAEAESLEERKEARRELSRVLGYGLSEFNAQLHEVLERLNASIPAELAEADSEEGVDLGSSELGDSGSEEGEGTTEGPTWAEGAGKELAASFPEEKARALYGLREEQERKQAIRAAGGRPEKVLASIQAGLSWLARHQLPDGCWDGHAFPTRCAEEGACSGRLKSDGMPLGQTALAMLAFGGLVADSQSRPEWEDLLTGSIVRPREVLDRALRWLLDQQDGDGSFRELGEARKETYQHALATQALIEAYGLTRTRETRQAAQKALGYLEKGMGRGSARGGWRYHLPSEKADMSVTGWCARAFLLAEPLELDFSRATKEAVLAYIEELTEHEDLKRRGLSIQYKVGYASREEAGLKVTIKGVNEKFGHHETLTASAAHLRMYWEPSVEDALLEGTAEMLLAELPNWVRRERDYYYWYHASLFLYDYAALGKSSSSWRKWYKPLSEVLAGNQDASGTGCQQGSWTYDSRWGRLAGRVYATALNCLTLETPFRFPPVTEFPRQD